MSGPTSIGETAFLPPWLRCCSRALAWARGASRIQAKARPIPSWSISSARSDRNWSDAKPFAGAALCATGSGSCSSGTIGNFRRFLIVRRNQRFGIENELVVLVELKFRLVDLRRRLGDLGRRLLRGRRRLCHMRVLDRGRFRHCLIGAGSSAAGETADSTCAADSSTATGSSSIFSGTSTAASYGVNSSSTAGVSTGTSKHGVSGLFRNRKFLQTGSADTGAEPRQELRIPVPLPLRREPQARPSQLLSVEYPRASRPIRRKDRPRGLLPPAEVVAASALTSAVEAASARR